MEEMPKFVLDHEPGVCSLSDHFGASKDLETHQKQAPEEILQYSRQSQQQKSTVSRSSPVGMALYTERMTGTNVSTPTLPLEAPESLRSVILPRTKVKWHYTSASSVVIWRLCVSCYYMGLTLIGGTTLGGQHCTTQHTAHIKIVAELLIAGADPEARDNEGRSPLHAAADAECEPIIRLLVREGADLNAAIGISGISSSEEGDMPFSWWIEPMDACS